MNICVTGATGFIGSHFVPLALGCGYSVKAIRRTESSSPRISWNKNPIFLNKTMSDLDEADFRNIDLIVHFAAHSANVPYDNLINCMQCNVMEPLQMFQKAMAAGVNRFVVAGSCFEYGKAGERYDFIPPDAPLEATQTYPASKAAASIAFRAFASENNAKVSIHRIFQVFGEGEPEGRLWPSLRKAALNGSDFPMTFGEQVRDFIDVKDVAKHFCKTLTQEIPSGVAFEENVGSGKPCSVRAFAESHWASWNPKGRLLFGEVPYRKSEVMRFVPRLT